MSDSTSGPRAVVLLSGGLDSATCLLLALAEGRDVSALSFDYGQRHGVELTCARALAGTYGAREHRIVRIDLPSRRSSALTDRAIAVPRNALGAEAIPVTYVPARNTLFLAHALSWAETLGAPEIFLGANALDYSGYPDCRPEFLEAFQVMANLGTKAAIEGRPFRIRAPLIAMRKSEIIRKAAALGLDLALTCSCYDPAQDGTPCRACDSCLLRRRGFEEADMTDPLSP